VDCLGLALVISFGAGRLCLGFPKPSPDVNKTMGMWGFWMPGFMQFITGIYLLVGLTWFDVFGNAAPLYMAGLALRPTASIGLQWPIVAT
jgi:hypothetical protein